MNKVTYGALAVLLVLSAWFAVVGAVVYFVVSVAKWAWN